MPIVQIECLPRSLEQKRQVCTEITEIICRTLICKPEDVRIIIRDMQKENYSVAGKLYADK